MNIYFVVLLNNLSFPRSISINDWSIEFGMLDFFSRQWNERIKVGALLGVLILHQTISKTADQMATSKGNEDGVKGSGKYLAFLPV